MDKGDDIIIVGGGIVGLWTCYQLLKEGYKCTLIEQFEYPHKNGSSHGETRIIRNSYVEKEYALMMPQSFKKWKELQDKTNRNLFIKTGIVSLFKEKTSEYFGMKSNLDLIKAKYDILRGIELCQKFPSLKFDNDIFGILDYDAGILKADECLLALRECIETTGGTIKSGEKVFSIKVGERFQTKIITSKNVYNCQNVVLTCGPWINKLLATIGSFQLKVEPWRINVRYWKENSKVMNVNNHFPILSFYMEPLVYMIPDIGSKGLIKMCSHSTNEITDPDDEKSNDNNDLNVLKLTISKHFPTVHKKPAITETCMYTVTPDNGFIMDTHPTYKNIVIGSGFSGHGFKTSPFVGQILANLVTGKKVKINMTPFACNRFTKPKLISKL